MLAPNQRFSPARQSGGPIEYVTVLVPVQRGTPLLPYMQMPCYHPPGYGVLLPMPPEGPVALTHDICSGGAGRIMYPHHPPTSHGALAYPSTPGANGPDGKDQKHGARARASNRICTRRFQPISLMKP